MEKTSVLDNEQVRLVAIGWLAGMIDGEGCLHYLQRHNRTKDETGKKVRTQNYRYFKKMVFQPALDIANMSIDGMEATIQALKLLSVPYWISSSYGKRGTMLLRVSGMRRLKPLLELLIPYLVIKQEEAKLMLELINSRLSHPPLGRGKGYAWWSEEEVALVEEVKRIKTTRNFRDYTPDILWKQDEDIVRPLEKFREAAEMTARRRKSVAK